jgi:hypothetical protein
MATTIWTLLSIFGIAPMVLLPLTGLASAIGSGTSPLRRRTPCDHPASRGTYSQADSET